MSEAQTNDSTSGSAPPRPTKRQRRPTSSYVLQASRQIDDVTAWVDVASIEVPASTRRTTALRRAAEAWGATLPEEGVEVRLIAGEDAKAMRIGPEAPPPPKLRIF